MAFQPSHITWKGVPWVKILDVENSTEIFILICANHTSWPSSILRTSSFKERKCQLTPVWKRVIPMTVSSTLLCCGLSVLSLWRDATPLSPLYTRSSSSHRGQFHNHCTNSRSVTWRILSSTPATRRYKAHLYTVNTHGATGLVISNTRWLITPQPLAGSQFCFLVFVGLDASYTPV